jgi:hypothetical protein
MDDHARSCHAVTDDARSSSPDLTMEAAMEVMSHSRAQESYAYSIVVQQATGLVNE